MSDEDPTRFSGSSPATGGAPGETGGGKPSRAGAWLIAILAAVGASLIAWQVAEAGTFQVEPAVERVMIMGSQTVGPTIQTRIRAAIVELSGVLGTFGLLLGAGLGTAGGFPARSRRRTLAGATAGGLLGAAAGLIMPWVVLPWYFRGQEQSPSDLVRSLVMHLGLWTLLGAAAGLGFGVGRAERPRSWVRAGIGGAIGAAIGTVLYEVVGAALFPLAETGEPFMTSGATRLMAFLLVALMTAATVTLAAVPAERIRAATSPASPPTT